MESARFPVQVRSCPLQLGGRGSRRQDNLGRRQRADLEFRYQFLKQWTQEAPEWHLAAARNEAAIRTPIDRGTAAPSTPQLPASWSFHGME
mmetsp:Transcript_91167/g.175521  ORF Transcript_91167/g.175521 Transcript_91167/m.175521 type:complete len:91 (+) Transcript_91167:394-666(+)